MTLLNDINVGGTDFRVMNFTPSGTCDTPAGTEVKVCSFADSFELVAGNSINVTFTYANTYGDGSTTYPKLQVNGTNYPIKNITGGYATNGAWANGQTVTFLFYGSGFTQISPTVTNEVTANNMYSVSSNAVYNLSSIKYQMNFNDEPKDVIAILSNQALKNEKMTLIEIGGTNIINAPDGTSANDFYYMLTKATDDWMIVTAFSMRDANTYQINKINGAWGSWHSIGLDGYEQTRYSATPNASYVSTQSTLDGVSAYKTKNGWKVLTGYFGTVNAIVDGVNLFTLPAEVMQTRPAQLWIPVVSINSGLTYLLLFGTADLYTWGGINPPANDLLFIPPVTYL